MHGRRTINAGMGVNESERNPAFHWLLGRVDLLVTVVYRTASFPSSF